MNDTDAAPSWFTRAIETPSEDGAITVDGTEIRYVAWGDVGKPGVVLIHGSNAHKEWWRFTAPFLADHFRVAALDLSGNGDSGWRKNYTGRGFADEVWAVCEAAQLGARPYVVGHSFGGFVALETAHYYREHVAAVVFMDFTVAPREQYVEWGLRAEREGVNSKRKLRVYETLDEIIGRFRFIPEQPGVHPLVLDHMARAGIKQVDGGYTWKFDPSLFDYLEMGIDQAEKFAALPFPSAVVLGEHSTDEGAFFADNMLRMTHGHLPVLTIPDTYHHLMFDEPLAVASSLNALLLQWHAADHAKQIRAGLDEHLEKFND